MYTHINYIKTKVKLIFANLLIKSIILILNIVTMRIGIDCRMIGSNFTGIGHYIENLVKHLSQKNKHNKYILFMNNPEYSQFKIPNKNFQKLLVDSPIYSFKEQTTFAKILYQHKLDLVHFPHFNAPILYLKKNIVTIHDVTLNTHAKKTKAHTLIHRCCYLLGLPLFGSPLAT